MVWWCSVCMPCHSSINNIISKSWHFSKINTVQFDMTNEFSLHSVFLPHVVPRFNTLQSCNSTPAHFFLAQCLIKHRDRFTFISIKTHTWADIYLRGHDKVQVISHHEGLGSIPYLSVWDLLWPRDRVISNIIQFYYFANPPYWNF
jgi:hypothetical protein